MKTYLSLHYKHVLGSLIILLTLTACGYERPAGKWTTLNVNELYFTEVKLADDAIDPNYKAVCKEARDEIQQQLISQLPKKIAPLTLTTSKNSTDNNDSSHDNSNNASASLTLTINRCEIDVDQTGDSFTYYLTLPIKINVTQNNENLLSYSIKTYEQVNISNPGPEFEFTFAEPVARTLLMFDGKRLWQADI